MNNVPQFHPWLGKYSKEAGNKSKALPPANSTVFCRDLFLNCFHVTFKFKDQLNWLLVLGTNTIWIEQMLKSDFLLVYNLKICHFTAFSSFIFLPSNNYSCFFLIIGSDWYRNVKCGESSIEFLMRVGLPHQKIKLIERVESHFDWFNPIVDKQNDSIRFI